LSKLILDELKKGNRRFLSGISTYVIPTESDRMAMISTVQSPIATVLCCSDSRVPPEMIFDQNFGKLFVIRNAGNLIDESVLASIEYAVNTLETPVVVVLGHDHCGAVAAAIANEQQTVNMNKLINKILPSVHHAKHQTNSDDALYNLAIELNIRNSASKLINYPEIQSRVSKKQVLILPAKYKMSSGEVVFL